MFKHFTRYAFYGATRYDVSGLPEDVYALAFRAPTPQDTEVGTASASLFLMNMGTTNYQIEVENTGLGSVIGGVFTSSEYDFQLASFGSYTQMPGMTIITVLFA